MDFNEIVIFTRIVQTGSFTAAARQLGLPKSTVSQKLSALEHRLGTRLLQRTTRKLGLTEVGREFFEQCARGIAEVEEAQRFVTRMQAAPTGLLRVSTPLTFSFLGPIVAQFLTRHPQVQVEVVCTDRRVDLVEEGFDVAIRAGQLGDSTLVARRLGYLRRILVASPDYLRLRGTPQTPTDLEQHDCIAFGHLERDRWKLYHGDRAQEVRVHARLVVNDLALVREAALANLGIAWVSEYLCLEDLKHKTLLPVLDEWTSPETPVHAVYPSTRHLSAKVSAFLEVVREQLPRILHLGTTV